jgi:peptidylprolyl isomerase
MDSIVKSGDQVEIEYVGRLKDGTVFDSTEGRDAFRFEAGGSGVIQGMSAAVLGMSLGQKKTFEIELQQAYGDYDESLLVKILRDRMPSEVEVGDALSDGSENTRVWHVRELTEEFGILDGNHPLAGESLIFDIELVSIV